MKNIFWLIVALSSIWVLYDAMKIRNTEGNKKGLAPVGWVLLCLCFWNIAFPIYLMKRKPVRLWKTIAVVVFFWVLPLAISLAIIGTRNFLDIQNRAKVGLENRQNDYSNSILNEYNDSVAVDSNVISLIQKFQKDSLMNIGNVTIKMGETETEVIKMLGNPLTRDTIPYTENGETRYLYAWGYIFNVEKELVIGMIIMYKGKVLSVIYPYKEEDEYQGK